MALGEGNDVNTTIKDFEVGTDFDGNPVGKDSDVIGAVNVIVEGPEKICNGQELNVEVKEDSSSTMPADFCIGECRAETLGSTYFTVCGSAAREAANNLMDNPQADDDTNNTNDTNDTNDDEGDGFFSKFKLW